MDIRCYRDLNAVTVLHDFARCNDNFAYAVRTWANDIRKRHCYILYINDVMTSIVLLRKCDRDALAEYNNPVWIDYVFTIPLRRRESWATKLLQHVQLHDTTIGIGDETMEKVFEKAGYHKTRNMNTNVYRYP
jgi:hypothetical protein